MNTRFVGTVAAVLCLAVPALTSLALAQTADRGAVPEQHDSNSLHKIGKSIQYPFRKAGENVSKSTRKGAKDVQYGARKNSSNLSVNAHRAVGSNSVVRRKNGTKRHDTVVTPGGHLKRLPKKQL